MDATRQNSSLHIIIHAMNVLFHYPPHSTRHPVQEHGTHTMISSILTLHHGLQAAFAAYNLSLAYTSITDLQKYEETSEKIAKYSNTAESELKKTRATQTSGTVAVCQFPVSPSLISTVLRIHVLIELHRSWYLF